MDFLQALAFFGIPAAVTGFFFWLLQRKLDRQAKNKDKADAEREAKAIEREKHREKLMMTIMHSTRACIVLSEATARAVQRIPDAQCNGDMTKALKYVSEMQNQQKDFLMELGVHSIYDYD